MKKILFSTMIASLLALVGCQNEELVNDNNTDNSGKKVILTANIQGAADSRVALTPETSNGATTVKVEWNGSGEKFKVYGYDNEESYFCGTPTWFTQIEGTNLFEGTLPESDKGTYLAVYGDDEVSTDTPLQYFLTGQDGTLTDCQSIPTEGEPFYLHYVLMRDTIDDLSSPIEFEHETAILKPTFKVGGADIDNTITQIVMGNVIYPTTAHAGYKEITIIPHLAEQIQSASGTTFTMDDDIYIHLPIIYIPDGKYSPNHEFTFTVTAGGKEYTGSLTIPEDMSIVAGKLYTADIALTEVLSAEYIWKSDITASESVEGEGTEASPYLIHSANDLQWMINQVNNAAPQPSPIDESENTTPQIPYYRLTHNLEIDSKAGATWTPIGIATSPFVGYFDGGGYTISGEMHTTTDLVGFFGYNAGSISNLKNTAEVKDCRTLMPASIEYSAIGSIAGYSIGKIINCENSGNVTAANITTTTYTGGICGYQYRDNCETIALITECKNSGNVTGVDDDDDDDATGGIVGCAVGIRVGQPYYSPIISACENAGFVTTGDNIGGICGLAKGATTIVACLNTGIAGVGGILGDGEIYDLYGCCTTQGYIRSKEVNSGFIIACYTFDVNYADEDEYVDYSEGEWVEEIVGPCNDEDHIDMGLTEMNYGIVCANAFNEYPCNWHWEVGEVGENYIPNLVEGAPLGSAGG